MLGNERVWLKDYSDGVPADVEADRFSSLMELLESTFAQYGESVAESYDGCDVTFSQLEQLSRSFASYLQNILHLETGDRLVIILHNCLQYIVAALGAIRAGIILVGVNPGSTERELAHLLSDCSPRAIFTNTETSTAMQGLFAEAGVRHVIVTDGNDYKEMFAGRRSEECVCFLSAINQGLLDSYKKPAVDGSSVAVIQYTGGTTGLPKGVMLTNRNLVFAVLAQSAWSAGYVRKDDVVLSIVPLYHIFGLVAINIRCLYTGCRNYLIRDIRNYPGIVEDLGRLRPAFLPGVSTVFYKLLKTPGFRDLDFSNLRLSVSGGMPTQIQVMEEWHRVTGQHIFEGYALTECGSCCCQSPYGKYEPGWVGVPYPSTYVSIQLEDGTRARPGEKGELCIKGPQVMLGYWNRPEETAAVIDKEGWLHSGDIATMDERGHIRIVGRIKDMIIVSGFNVYPAEVEYVARQIPRVADAVCVGIPDARTGERVRLYVVKKDSALSESTVLEYCGESLVRYKVPKEILFIDRIPKTSLGKIMRYELKNP